MRAGPKALCGAAPVPRWLVRAAVPDVIGYPAAVRSQATTSRSRARTIAGVYLFAGLTLFGTFKTPALYMAALAFTSYGVHWFAIGWNRLRGTDPRVNVGMTVAFLLISNLGVIVFFKVGDAPVGGVFIGLVCVYAADFFASLKPDLPKLGGIAERVLGFFRLGTAFWLMYLVFAVVLNFVLKYTLPL